MLQARRLSDPAYGFVAVEAQRPRALVILLALYNAVFRLLTGQYPTLPAYHVLMTAVTVAYLLVWRRIFYRFTDRVTADLTCILLLSCQMLLHYAMMVMTDVLSGLLWGVTLLTFQRFWRDFLEPQRGTLVRHIFALALVGALVGLSKHHLLTLLPLMLGITLAAGVWRKIVPPQKLLAPLLVTG